jgi:hypothetical protein
MPFERKKKKLTNVRVDAMWWHHNDQNQNNSVTATLDFISKAVDKATEEGYDNLRVQPVSREGDEGTIEAHYIFIIGDRMETDKEFQSRMKSALLRMKEDSKEAIAHYNYFETAEAKAILEELEKLSKGNV